MADIFKSGTEVFIVIIMVLGVLISIAIPSKPLSFFVILLSGFAAGKIVYSRRYKTEYKKQDIVYFIVEEFPYLIIILAFLGGYVLGSYNISRKAIFALFLVSFVISYYFHYKKIFIYHR